MQNRKIFILGLIAVLILFLLLATLVIIQGVQSQNSKIQSSNNIVSNVVSNSNIINLNSNANKDFNFVVIKEDNTIELKNTKGESFIIQLNNQNWKNIKANPQGNLIAVLGESKLNIWDLYIYNANLKTWSKATSYSNFDSGIVNYKWINDNTIIFEQGEVPNKWIHSFNYISKEILKIINVKGSIGTVNLKSTTFSIEEKNTASSFYNLEGIKLFDLNEIKDATTTSTLNLFEPKFFVESTELIANSNTGYYLIDTEQKIATNTNIDSEYSIICSNTQNTMLFYKIDNSDLKIYSFNKNILTFDQLYNFPLNSINTIDNTNSFCKNNIIYLKTTKSNNSFQWYKIIDQKIEIDKIFNNLEFIDVIK